MPNTPVSKVIATTGASGANGFLALVTAQNAAMVTAVAAITGVTGAVLDTASIGEARLTIDTQSNILEMIQTLTYIVVS